MKEYISKEELLEYMHGMNMLFSPKCAIEAVNTVTKADICQEFAEKIKDRVPFRVDDGDYSDGFNDCSKKVLTRIDKLLEEMEVE